MSTPLWSLFLSIGSTRCHMGCCIRSIHRTVFSFLCELSKKQHVQTTSQTTGELQYSSSALYVMRMEGQAQLLEMHFMLLMFASFQLKGARCSPCRMADPES